MTPTQILFAILGSAFVIAVGLFKKFYMPSLDNLTEVEFIPLDPPKDTSSPQTHVVEPSGGSQGHLEAFCACIRDYEGKPGALNYQLNNPGDCRPSSVGYLPKYGHVEIIDTDTDPRYPYHKGKFAKFPTYELGWEYLLNLVHFTSASHPSWTILDFFKHYAPSSDANDPNHYAEWVAQRMGTTPHDMLASVIA